MTETTATQTFPKDDTASINVKALTRWQNAFESDDTLGLAGLILNRFNSTKPLQSRKAIIANPYVFNTVLKGLDDKGAYTAPRLDQGLGGRCWLFAATNVLRYHAMKQLNVAEFKFSISYLYFYDKLEKANFYLEAMIALADEPLDSRLVTYICGGPTTDGGHWHMTKNLIEKYGLVPESVYPESYSSATPGGMYKLLRSRVRAGGLAVRHAEPQDRQKVKERVLNDVYNVLSIALGVPPRADHVVKWEYLDKENKAQSWSGTPLDFARQYTPDVAADSIILCHDPRHDVDKLFTIEWLGNVHGARRVQYVTAPITALEDAVIKCINADTPVQFECDVDQSSDFRTGIMDLNLYPLDKAYGFSLELSKADRMRMGETCLAHAMVITAVHLDNDSGRPVRYKVENSWSADKGEDGFFLMTAEWFREHVFQVIVPRALAEERYLQVLDKGEATLLPPWGPTGSPL